MKAEPMVEQERYSTLVFEEMKKKITWSTLNTLIWLKAMKT